MATLSLRAQRIRLDIAGLPLALVSDDPEVLAAARSRFATSIAGDDSPPVVVTQVSLARGALPSGVLDLTVDGNLVAATGGGFEGRFDRGTGRAELCVGPIDIDVALENYLRVLTAILILDRGGILLHSSAVIRRGEGFVFFGPSGAGKSTTALLSHQRGYAVLSDDQTIIYPSGDGVVVHGVPFRGGQCPVPVAPGVAPLRRLLSLQKDSRVELQPAPLVMGAALLTTQTALVNWQEAFAERVLDNCVEIARRVPVEILHFTKDATYWQTL
jgi:hypothetical protein